MVRNAREHGRQCGHDPKAASSSTRRGSTTAPRTEVQHARAKARREDQQQANRQATQRRRRIPMPELRRERAVAERRGRDEVRMRTQHGPRRRRAVRVDRHRATPAARRRPEDLAAPTYRYASGERPKGYVNAGVEAHLIDYELSTERQCVYATRHRTTEPTHVCPHCRRLVGNLEELRNVLCTCGAFIEVAGAVLKISFPEPAWAMHGLIGTLKQWLTQTKRTRTRQPTMSVQALGTAVRGRTGPGPDWEQ